MELVCSSGDLKYHAKSFKTTETEDNPGQMFGFKLRGNVVEKVRSSTPADKKKN